jgi:hypothetical protein
VLDNRSGSLRPLGAASTSRETRLALPADPGALGPGAYLMAEIRTRHEKHPRWAGPVRVYLRPRGSSYEIVGIHREAASP